MHVRLDDSTVDLEVPLTAGGNRVTVAIRAGDILVADRAPVGISARNVLEGQVEAVRRQGPTVVARVAAGIPFLVHVTPAGAENLRMEAGSRVWLIIKTYSCRIAAG